MNLYEQLIIKIPLLEKRIDYSFSNRDLLIRACIHSSFLNENKMLQLKHNERLEFLGDSVLNLLVAEYLFDNFPELPEGELSSMRSSIISSASCIQFVKILDLEEYIVMGKGEHLSSSKRKTSILADFFEALLGAIYLDGGLEKAEYFFFTHFVNHIHAMLKAPQNNYKALLQQYLQKMNRLVPTYSVVKELGLDHEKEFIIGVYADNVLLGSGTGTSKKEAEQMAAKNALDKFEQKE